MSYYDPSQQQRGNNPFTGSTLDFASSQYNYGAPQQQPQQQQHSASSPFYVPGADWQQQQPNYFVPPSQEDYGSYGGAQTGGATGAVDFDNEPPLLEELGINFEHIYRKTTCVLNPLSKPHESIINDEDLAGPLVFCIAYGFSLLLMGKIHFGYIYGITALGCVSMYALLNLMSEKGVSACCISSTLGYCLLPMVIFSFLSVVLPVTGLFGLILSCLFVLWCSVSASKLFVNALHMSNQQILVLYPCSLLYGIFALLNVF